MTSVHVMQLWLHVISVGTICFGDRLCACKEDGIGEGGVVSARGALHMAAALDDRRKALVGTGWAILTQIGVDMAPLPLRGSIFGTVSSFQLGEAFTGWRALTIKSALMSGHSRGHKPWEA